MLGFTPNVFSPIFSIVLSCDAGMFIVKDVLLVPTLTPSAG